MVKSMIEGGLIVNRCQKYMSDNRIMLGVILQQDPYHMVLGWEWIGISLKWPITQEDKEGVPPRGGV